MRVLNAQVFTWKHLYHFAPAMLMMKVNLEYLMKKFGERSIRL